MNGKVFNLLLFTSVTQSALCPILSAIRIFGIFTHAELKRRRFWDILSRQIQQRGQDYIDRCTFRNKPFGADDNAILPASYPVEEVQDIQGAESLPEKVSEEDMKEVSSDPVSFGKG